MVTFLKDCKENIEKTAKNLGVFDDFIFIEKHRALGFVPKPGKIPRSEACDEIALAVQHEVKQPPFKYCCFHSNHQMYVIKIILT